MRPRRSGRGTARAAATDAGARTARRAGRREKRRAITPRRGRARRASRMRNAKPAICRPFCCDRCLPRSEIVTPGLRFSDCRIFTSHSSALHSVAAPNAATARWPRVPSSGRVVRPGSPMRSVSDDHERTMAFADIALGQIKALRQPATPRNYEIWYSYATGYWPSLNQKINETLKRNGTLTEADLDDIYDHFLAPSRLSERIESLGSKVRDEIDQVMAKIDESKDREGLRAIVEGLVQTAKEMEATNQQLEARLNASKREINELQAHLEALRSESLTDPLTQLANRKFFDDTLQHLIAEARAHGQALSLMMTDIDDFKAFNDKFGHLTGDQVLRLVAMTVRQNVKGQDVTARYGGEEFAVILPNTALRAAITLADQIRRAVMTKELMKRSTGEHLGRITISVGVATLHKTDNAQSLIERADACLYAAKRQGRNRVICEIDPEMTAAAASAAPAA